MKNPAQGRMCAVPQIQVAIGAVLNEVPLREEEANAPEYLP